MSQRDRAPPINVVFNIQPFVRHEKDGESGQISKVLKHYTDVEDLSTFNVSSRSLSLKDKRGKIIWLIFTSNKFIVRVHGGSTSIIDKTTNHCRKSNPGREE